VDQKIAERLKKPEIGIATYMDTPITISHRERPARQSNHLTIGVLIFPRLDQIDMTGPLEVLSRIPNSTIHVIAKTKSPVRDIQGLVLTPGISIAGAPELDVLLVPGGFGQQQLMNDEEVLSLIRNHFTAGRLVFSVCTGALLCGAAGVLRGRQATTHWATWNLLPYYGAIPVRSRVVVDGNLVIAGGVTARPFREPNGWCKISRVGALHSPQRNHHRAHLPRSHRQQNAR
jgi:cyclohexyl-isocyanide hydratase